MHLSYGALNAVLAALLFGLSAPAAKLLAGEIHPFLLAGILYCGSGIGVSIWIFLKSKIFSTSLHSNEASLSKKDLPWLLGATLAGGFLAPILLVFGLKNSAASAASLLLNLEGVFTAILAWFVFRENFDNRIALGMVFITAGGALLSWTGTPDINNFFSGPALIIAACLLWGIDNNLTKKVSAGDPFQITAFKGILAGFTNLFISTVILNVNIPSFKNIAAAMTVGFLGYGLSLVLFVLALRHIGTSRTGAYFSLAPFFGAFASFLIFNDQLSFMFLISAFLMAAGVYCHVTENHEHEHIHATIVHEHSHCHDGSDEHHNHIHQNETYIENHKHAIKSEKLLKLFNFFHFSKRFQHSHVHVHNKLIHKHSHYPDIHHEHEHQH